MVVLKTIKVKASTLVETIIALTLIMFVFGLATTIFVRLINSNLSTTALRAEKTLENFRLTTHNELAYFDEQVNEDGFIIKRWVEEESGGGNLIRLRFQVLDDQHNKLSEIKELVMKRNTIIIN